jgi:hypothetical protein
MEYSNLCSLLDAPLSLPTVLSHRWEGIAMGSATRRRVSGVFVVSLVSDVGRKRDIKIGNLCNVVSIGLLVVPLILRVLLF